MQVSGLVVMTAPVACWTVQGLCVSGQGLCRDMVRVFRRVGMVRVVRVVRVVGIHRSQLGPIRPRSAINRL